MRARVDLLGADQGGGEGQAPTVGVEHGHHGHDSVTLLEAEGVDHGAGEAVQDDGPVRVDDPLGAARGPGRVTHARAHALAQRRPLPALDLVFDQDLLVVLVAVVSRCQRLTGRTKHEHLLEGGVSDESRQQRQEHVVDDQEAIFGVVADVAQVAGRKPQVQGVVDAAGQGHTKVGLEVSVVIPHQRGDPLPWLQTRLDQAPGERPCAPLKLGVAVAAQGLVGELRDDLDLGEQARSPSEEVVEGQGEVHHRPSHGASRRGSHGASITLPPQSTGALELLTSPHERRRPPAR